MDDILPNGAPNHGKNVATLSQRYQNAHALITRREAEERQITASWVQWDVGKLALRVPECIAARHKC